MAAAFPSTRCILESKPALDAPQMSPTWGLPTTCQLAGLEKLLGPEGLTTNIPPFSPHSPVLRLWGSVLRE